MGEAARLVDAVAHRHAGGRWLATGGGGYDAYRVVPRAWSLIWLAGNHREVPATTDAGWRERWTAEAARYGQVPLPATFDDSSNAGLEMDVGQVSAEARSRDTASLVRRMFVPRLLREARDRGWWDPAGSRPSATPVAGATDRVAPTVLSGVDAERWSRLSLAPRVIAPADAADGHALVLAAIRHGAHVTAAVADDLAVGLAVACPADADRRLDLLALGVAPTWRTAGLAGRLLEATPADRAEVTLAERDPREPLDVAVRRRIAVRLLERAGFLVGASNAASGPIDPTGLVATRGGAPPRG